MRSKVKPYTSEIIEIVSDNLSPKVIADRLQNYHENDLADAYIAIDTAKRQKMCRVLDVKRLAAMFEYMDPNTVVSLLNEMDLSVAVAIAAHMDAEELSNILRLLPKDRRNVALQSLDERTRNSISLLAAYDDDQIGSHMSTNFVAIPYDLTIKQALDELIHQAVDHDNITTIFVLAEDGKYYGAINLKELIRARQDDELESKIVTSYPYVYGNELTTNCLETLKNYSEDSIPVLSDDNRLLGVITSMDVVDIVDNELGEDYARLAGLSAEEDLKETLSSSIKKRLPWLLILLVLGMGVSTVVGAFENIVSQLPLIMAFQSLILDMAGNVGTQSLAVTIRVLMDENLTFTQRLKLVGKELRVGTFNGIILGVLAFIALGLYIMFFKHKTFMFAFAVSGCIGISLLTSMMVSSLVGTLIPIFFKRIHIDPAAASGPLITTVNDLVAVICYYGLSWILLINLFHLG